MNTKKKSSHEETHDLTEATADIFLTGARVLNVYSGELLKTNVAIKQDRIWYVGPSSHVVSEDTRVLDIDNKVLVPGYIDPHFHPWFVYNPVSFAEEACRLGTTTLFCDNLIFYMLMGPELFERFMDFLSEMPVKFFWFCRAVPQTPMVTEDKLFSFENLKRLFNNPLVKSLGEITRWRELLKGNKKIMETIKAAKTAGKRVDGHTAGAKYEELNVISRSGVESCHESINAGEALERLRLGFYVILRESSLRQDLSDLLRIVTENKVLTDRIMLTTDASSPLFYEEFGATNHVLEIAIKEGIDPIMAYRMVTINPAVYFGMDHEVGGIAPGRYADILVLKDLVHPTPELVISRGRIIAEHSNLVEPFPWEGWEAFFPSNSFSGRTWSAKGHLFQIASPEKSISFRPLNLSIP